MNEDKMTALRGIECGHVDVAGVVRIVDVNTVGKASGQHFIS